MQQKTTSGRALSVFGTKRRVAPTETSKTTDVIEIVELEHEKYRIRAGRLGGTYVARAFPKPPTKAQGLIAEAEGQSEEAAVMALRSLIEARDVRRKDVRRWDEVAMVSVPSEEEFTEALRQARLSRPQIAMLTAHAYAHEDGMTFAQLARVSGYKSPDMAGKVFGKAGELIADYLGIKLDDDTPPDREGAILLLAAQSIQGEDTPTVWVMHHELRDAVKVAL